MLCVRQNEKDEFAINITSSMFTSGKKLVVLKDARIMFGESIASSEKVQVIFCFYYRGGAFQKKNKRILIFRWKFG